MADKLTAIKRLEKLLNERDEEIERLQFELSKAEDKLKDDQIWTRHLRYEDSKAPGPKLPVPRLEIRWREAVGDEREHNYEVVAVYSLVYRHLLDETVYVPLGMTRSTGSLASRFRWDAVETPFRDGAHMFSDAKQLGLPAFAIVGDKVTKYEQCGECKYFVPTEKGKPMAHRCKDDK